MNIRVDRKELLRVLSLFKAKAARHKHSNHVCKSVHLRVAFGQDDDAIHEGVRLASLQFKKTFSGGVLLTALGDLWIPSIFLSTYARHD